MKTNEIKKGMRIKSVQLGKPVTGTMMDSMRGDTRMIATNGSEIGMFDEIGSVYCFDIIEVEVGDKWATVEHTPKQLKLKEDLKDFFKENVGNPAAGIKL